MDIRHLLVPTDFSEASNRAVEYAFGLAQTCGAKLTFLHVVELPSYLNDGHAPTNQRATLQHHLASQAQGELARLLANSPGTRVEIARQVVVGVPSQTITETAAAEHVDLIVMATHGRTGFSDLVMGSVAERVVRTAPCPVLTLRPVLEQS